MADAFVNFFSKLDAVGGAQAFQGEAAQEYRALAGVGANAAAATVVALVSGTRYAEVKATSGNVFACILPTGASEAARTAARIRIDQGEKITLTRARSGANSLYIWAV